MEIYLVGGAVRDRLLGRPSSDRDFVVIGGTKESFLKRFPKAKIVGRRIPVFLVGNDEYTLAEAMDIQEDLLRRDLTINAVAEDAAGKLYFLKGAKEDLANRVFRAVAKENFFSDPLRVLRVARMAAQMPEFTFAEDLLSLMTEVASGGFLEDLAAERVGAEVRKACGGRAPARFFSVLKKAEALFPWFREWENAARIPAGPAPYHDGSLEDHTLAIMNGCTGDPIAVWMAFCHDLGKCLTPPSFWPRHHGHEMRGMAVAQTLAERLRLPLLWVEAGVLASRWHMAAGRYHELRAGTRLDLLSAFRKKALLDAFIRLVKEDSGVDITAFVAKDLTRLQAVKLPVAQRNLGPKSGEIHRSLKCQALGRVVTTP